MTPELFEAIIRALDKAKSLYREVQPDAKVGECWAEFEALESTFNVIRKCTLAKLQFSELDWEDLRWCGCSRCLSWYHGEVRP